MAWLYDQQLCQQINEILFRDWDPIGVYPEPACTDEYWGYAQHLCSYILAGAPREQIAEVLHRFERDSMESPTSQSLRLEVADKLSALVTSG